MIYFIPSWWKKGTWAEDEHSWYEERVHTETDDTVKHIQLFHRNEICDYKVLVLNHAPNLRHFLHRQSIYRANYWSAFDTIQCVTKTKPVMLSYRKLPWPEDAEFIYTMFSIVVMSKGSKYAQIEFSEYGNLYEVYFYANGEPFAKNTYDDRGFVSCSTRFTKGKFELCTYYDELGNWRIAQYKDGKVAVNSEYNFFVIGNDVYQYNKLEYDSMDELMAEIFVTYLSNTNDQDVFCVAACGDHDNVINSLLDGRRVIYSVFAGREYDDAHLLNGSCIITDSEDNFKKVISKELLVNTLRVNLTPYDTRIDYNMSSRLHVQNILIPIDSLTRETIAETILNIAEYLKKNDNARIHLYTRNVNVEDENDLLVYISKVLETNGYPGEWAYPYRNTKGSRIITVDKCVNEIQTNKCLKEQRLYLDLANEPDLFLQISCLSLGIPQILKTENKYMKNHFNGTINEDIKYLQRDISFYLENLSNWNIAMVNSYKLGEEYSKNILIEKWKEVIRLVTGN